MMTDSPYEAKEIEMTSRSGIANSTENLGRRSILELEKSRRQQFLGKSMFVLLSLASTTLSSIAFFNSLNLMPAKPSTREFVTALAQYQQFSDNVSNSVADEMSDVYYFSKINQSTFCAGQIGYISQQQNNSVQSAFAFQSNYCVQHIDRIWRYLNVDRGINTDSYTPCNAPTAVTYGPRYISWIATPNPFVGSELNWACDEFTSSTRNSKFSGQCLMSIYIRQKPTKCTPFFSSWDKWRNFQTSLQNTRVCESVQQMMKNRVDLYKSESEKTQNFLDSLNARLEYDRNYFLGWQNAKALLQKIRFNMTATRSTIASWYMKAENTYNAQKKYLQELKGPYDTVKNIYDQIPGFDPQPSFSIPGFGSYSPPNFGGINLAANGIDVLPDYNPTISLPTQSFPNLNFSGINGYLPQFKFQLSLENSVLVEDIKKMVEYVGNFISFVSAVDFIFRIIVWFQFVAKYMKGGRRNLVSLKSKIKGAIGFLMSNAILFLYLGVFLSLAKNILTFDLNFGFLGDELTNQCSNKVLTNNGPKLYEYQTDLIQSRAQCDSTINFYNNKTSNLNEGLVNRLNRIAIAYESLYIPDNKNSLNFTTDTLERDNIILSTFALNKSIPISTAKLGNGTTKSVIESYTISTDSCTSTTEAKTVTDQLNSVTEGLKLWISATSFALVLANIGNRLIISGIFEIFWMHLTAGYVFDKAFDSNKLRSVIREKRILGLLLILVGIILIIVASQNKPIIYKF
jgi:hypothetical protein